MYFKFLGEKFYIISKHLQRYVHTLNQFLTYFSSNTFT